MSKTVDIEKTAYYIAAVDRFSRRLLDRLEREKSGAVTANDVYQVARSVIRDIELPFGQVLAFPVAIGDTVECACEEFDDDGNPVTELVPYKVEGLAFYKGKYYALDEDGRYYEVGTRFCIAGGEDEESLRDNV